MWLEAVSGWFGSDGPGRSRFSSSASRQPGLEESVLLALGLPLPAPSTAPGEQAGRSSEQPSTRLAGGRSAPVVLPWVSARLKQR